MAETEANGDVSCLFSMAVMMVMVMMVTVVLVLVTVMTMVRWGVRGGRRLTGERPHYTERHVVKGVGIILMDAVTPGSLSFLLANDVFDMTNARVQ